jgi:hypothetical protein
MGLGNNKIRLIPGFGVMGDDCFNERRQQRFSTFSGAVHALEEREVERQLFMAATPRCRRSHERSSDQKPSIVLT